MDIEKFIAHFINLRLKELGKNYKWLAHESGLTQSHLSLMMHRYSDWKLKNAEKVLNAVGYKVCVVKKTEWDK